MNKLLLLLSLIIILPNFIFAQSEQQKSQPDLKINDINKEKLYMTLGEALMEPDKVLRLCQGGQNLTTISDDVKMLINLREINLSANNFETVPPVLCSLLKLEDIRLASNNLKTLPKCFADLQNLKSLDLSSNSKLNIQESLEILVKLKNLQTLDLSFNEINNISNIISNFKNLNELDLEGNNFDEKMKNIIQHLLPSVKIHF
jgi:Leucine-rich repeat (LRR) protein